MITSRLVCSVFYEMHGKVAEGGDVPNLWQETNNACRLRFNYTLGL